MLNALRFAIRSFMREIRAGEWLIVFLALLLAVTAITSLHFYTDRLSRAFALESAKFLGGDLVISSPSPIPPSWTTKAQTLFLRTAEVWSFPTVVSAKENLHLVYVQAVSQH